MFGSVKKPSVEAFPGTAGAFSSAPAFHYRPPTSSLQTLVSQPTAMSLLTHAAPAFHPITPSSTGLTPSLPTPSHPSGLVPVIAAPVPRIPQPAQLGVHPRPSDVFFYADHHQSPITSAPLPTRVMNTDFAKYLHKRKLIKMTEKYDAHILLGDWERALREFRVPEEHWLVNVRSRFDESCQNWLSTISTWEEFRRSFVTVFNQHLDVAAISTTLAYCTMRRNESLADFKARWIPVATAATKFMNNTQLNSAWLKALSPEIATAVAAASYLWTAVGSEIPTTDVIAQTEAIAANMNTHRRFAGYRQSKYQRRDYYNRRAEAMPITETAPVAATSAPTTEVKAPTEKRECFECKEIGHIARNCPTKKGGRKRSSRSRSDPRPKGKHQ